jgi:predicted phosphatase
MKKLLLLFVSLTLLIQFQMGQGSKKPKIKPKNLVYVLDTIRVDTIKYVNGVKTLQKGKDIRNPVPPAK